jgi:tetratricopeptide (TPR) repeat protein
MSPLTRARPAAPALRPEHPEHREPRRLLPAAALLALLVAGAGCLEPPGVGRAADPTKAPGQAPWGSATSNAELEKKMKLLEDILDGKLQPVDLPKRTERDWPDLTPDQRRKSLEGITQLMEDLQKSGRAGKAVAAGPDREMARAQLYFSERRFIEAATILSKILDANPIYPDARNLLARCFFFLQNRDRTIVELEYILTNPEQQKDREEVLGALFLLGAAVAETPGMSRENMQKGEKAWETYLKLAPDSPQRDHIERGLVEIRAGLAGQGRLAQPLVPTSAEADGEAPANVMGGPAQPAPMGPGASGEPATKVKRTAQLGEGATAAERALAEGLDALEARDLATAEQRLNDALAASPSARDAAEARVGLGRVFVQSGRIDEALRAFGEVIRVDPDFMPAWHYLGMAHMMGGDAAQAVQSWQKIVDKDPEYARRFKLDQRIEAARRMGR